MYMDDIDSEAEASFVRNMDDNDSEIEALMNYNYSRPGYFDSLKAEVKAAVEFCDSSYDGAEDEYYDYYEEELSRKGIKIYLENWNQGDDRPSNGAQWDDSQLKWYVNIGLPNHKLVCERKALEPYNQWHPKGRKWLVCSYHEKEDVKKLGARWDPEVKQWWFDANNNKLEKKFSKWLPSLQEFDEEESDSDDSLDRLAIKIYLKNWKKGDSRPVGAQWDDSESQWYVNIGCPAYQSAYERKRKTLEPYNQWHPKGRKWLVCDYHENEEVKKLGARWDPEVKQWWFDAHPSELEKEFEKWLPTLSLTSSNTDDDDNSDGEDSNDCCSPSPSKKQKRK